MARSILELASIVGLTLLLGCTAPVEGARIPLVMDGGALLAPVADLDQPPCTPPDTSVTCTIGYPPFLCQGRCPAGELCCVTGVRPMGVCRTLDGCADQCAYDCGMVGETSGQRARLICEAFCLTVPPEVSCQ